MEKSQAELAPARLIHRAKDMIMKIGNILDNLGNVSKIRHGNQIKLNGSLLAWSFRGELRWFTLANNRCSAEQRDQAVGFATA